MGLSYDVIQTDWATPNFPHLEMPDVMEPETISRRAGEEERGTFGSLPAAYAGTRSSEVSLAAIGPWGGVDGMQGLGCRALHCTNT
jgi:hypothetical protein